jgi:hypothetical protein
MKTISLHWALKLISVFTGVHHWPYPETDASNPVSWRTILKTYSGPCLGFQIPSSPKLLQIKCNNFSFPPRMLNNKDNDDDANSNSILAHFLYFEKNDSMLMLHPCCLCACVSHFINFWMAEPIFIKLGMQVMAPETISTTYFINPFHQFVCVYVCICLYVYLPVDASQRLSKDVTAAIIYTQQ